jgi:hypothetical protein
VIATGLNGDGKREYNSIPHSAKPEFTLPRVDNNITEEDNHISAFQESSTPVNEPESTPTLFKEDDSDGETEGPVITFGDDLDVPAFIRNRQE